MLTTVVVNVVTKTKMRMVGRVMKAKNIIIILWFVCDIDMMTSHGNHHTVKLVM